MGLIRELAGILREWMLLPVRAAQSGGPAEGKPAGAQRRFLPLPVRGVTIAFLAGIGVAIAGPYGTDRLSFALGALYWCGLTVSGLLIWWFAFRRLCRARMSARWPLAARIMAANAAMTLAGSVLVVEARDALGLALPGTFLVSVADVVIPFFVIAALVVTPIVSLATGRRPSVPAATASAARKAAFLERFPAAVQGELQYLKAEDHYVRVHTDRGSHLMLLRLRDAVRELGDEAGERCHRSFWVASCAVRRLEGTGRSLTLCLKNGDRVPVSRSCRKAAIRRWGPPRRQAVG